MELSLAGRRLWAIPARMRVREFWTDRRLARVRENTIAAERVAPAIRRTNMYISAVQDTLIATRTVQRETKRGQPGN